MSTHEVPAKKTIPAFTTREEEAEFWDSHDIADYWDDLKPVTLKANDDVGMAFLIRLDANQFSQLLRLADEQGVAFDALASEWVVERLRDADTLTPG
ncbi:MAG: CopG family antitoxin [Chloroflexota bacterium]|nr:CopG family antitoxin [Chloroflexota bacterium]MDE2960786.1 CopG family antitoxin [Chloroflexota bacterium]